MQKSADAFRTISEVADDLSLPQHVLRFWETRFPQVRPLKRAGGRRYYRPNDIVLLRAIRQLLYDDGYTIKGVQRLLKEQGPKGLASAPRPSFAEGTVDDQLVVEETDGLPAPASPQNATMLAATHRADLEASLAVIEECKRILDALHQS